MTTLYRPVLIESAAQAEALPEGSIVINDDGDRYSRHPRWGEWHSVADDRDLTEDLDSTFRPPTITALVPIEAEEEARGITTWPRPDNAPWPERSDLYSNSAGEHYYRDEDGVAHDITEEMTAWLAAQPVHTRYVTP